MKDIKNKEKFEANIQKLSEMIYEDVLAAEKAGNFTLTPGEQREEIAYIMTNMFNMMDENTYWEISVIYDTMEEFRKAHKE